MLSLFHKPFDYVFSKPNYYTHRERERASMHCQDIAIALHALDHSRVNISWPKARVF